MAAQANGLREWGRPRLMYGVHAIARSKFLAILIRPPAQAPFVLMRACPVPAPFEHPGSCLAHLSVTRNNHVTIQDASRSSNYYRTRALMRYRSIALVRWVRTELLVMVYSVMRYVEQY